MLQDTVAELEGGEVGSGHTFTAVYEIIPATYFNDSIKGCGHRQPGRQTESTL